MKVKRLFIVSLALLATACKPAAPPGLVETGRQGLEQARAVQGVLLQKDDAQRSSVDQASK